MTSTASFSPDSLVTLRCQLSPAARIALPSDLAYAGMIDNWNKDFSGRPTVVIEVACTADVVSAIVWLRALSLPFTVGGGLHSHYSMRNGHVLLYLGGMRSVRVDSTAAVAYVQGGARNQDLDETCSKYHLYTTAGTNPDTGCGGLMLGGGVGYLARRCGLSIDQLIEVELVDCNGQVMRVNESQHPELFWAVKGAGFNFGVVTEFVLRLHRVDHQVRELTSDDEQLSTKHNIPPQQQLANKMLQGALIYPLHHVHNVMAVLDRWAQQGKNGPMGDRCIAATVALAIGPQGRPVCIVNCVHTGDVYAGYRVVDALIAEIGPPLVNHVHPDTYIALQHSLDHVTPPGFWHERSFIAQSTPPACVDAVVQSFKSIVGTPGLERSIVVLSLYGADGALTDRPASGSAFSPEQRSGTWWILVIAKYEPQLVDRSEVVRVCNGVRAAILPFCSTQYTNSSNNQPGARVLFGSSLSRLRQVKQRYDPDNVFCNNNNVVPADKAEESSATAQQSDD